MVEPDHLFPGPGAAIGQKKIDGDAGLNRADVLQFGSHGVERRDVLAAPLGARPAQPRLEVLRVGDLLAENIGLAVIDLGMAEAIAKLEQRTVRFIATLAMVKTSGQRRAASAGASLRLAHCRRGRKGGRADYRRRRAGGSPRRTAAPSSAGERRGARRSS